VLLLLCLGEGTVFHRDPWWGLVWVHEVCHGASEFYLGALGLGLLGLGFHVASSLAHVVFFLSFFFERVGQRVFLGIRPRAYFLYGTDEGLGYLVWVSAWS
jgi:hypothetical protein